MVEGGSGIWTDVIEVQGGGHPGTSWTVHVDQPGIDVAGHAGVIDFAGPVSGHIEWADGSKLEFHRIERITY